MHENEEEYLIFNEYAMDDTLDPLQRLIRYHTSDFSLQRMVLIRELTDTARFAGYSETVKTILPMLNTFVGDTEPQVRQVFVQQLHTLAEFVVENGADEGKKHLRDAFLPFAFELLVDKNVEVGNAALEVLSKLAELVSREDVEHHLLHVVITLAHDDRADDYRSCAAQLFNDLAEHFGGDLCSTVALVEVKLLSGDASFATRKAVAGNLSKIAKVVGPAVAQEKVLPIFLSLCKDDIWSVRKACAESIVGVSEALAPEVRSQHLVTTFKALSEDASRWVRAASYQHLGQFIHTMRRDDISGPFLKMFTDMAFQGESGESDFAEYCSYSFPAVTQVLGPERWKELDDAFNTLLKEVSWKVRRCLAYSLHEVAQVVGQDVSEKSLVPAFETFLKDLDEVKLGVMLNIDKFFAVLSTSTRERFVPTLCNVPVESENWRLRNVVASKLGELARLVSPEIAKGPVAEIVLKLLDDSVTEVRTSTFHSCGQLLLHLHGTPYYDDFAQQVEALATRTSFQGRQMFAYIFQQVVEIDGLRICEKSLLDKFVALGGDSVGNVRFVVARVLANSCNNNDAVKNNAKIKQLTKTLTMDSEQDVAALAAAKLPRLANPALAAAYRLDV